MEIEKEVIRFEVLSNAILNNGTVLMRCQPLLNLLVTHEMFLKRYFRSSSANLPKKQNKSNRACIYIFFNFDQFLHILINFCKYMLFIIFYIL